MTPTPRTPQLRDRRFARVRRLSQAAFLGSGLASAALVGMDAAGAHTTNTIPTVPTTTPVSTSTSTSTSTPNSPATHNPATNNPTPTTVYRPPTTAPVTTTTICYTSASGIRTCYAY